MSGSGGVARRFGRSLARAAVFAAGVAGVAAADAGPAPWEVWRDPLHLARIRPDVRVVTRSSADPAGGAFDRHRFVRLKRHPGMATDKRLAVPDRLRRSQTLYPRRHEIQRILRPVVESHVDVVARPRMQIIQ